MSKSLQVAHSSAPPCAIMDSAQLCWSRGKDNRCSCRGKACVRPLCCCRYDWESIVALHRSDLIPSFFEHLENTVGSLSAVPKEQAGICSLPPLYPTLSLLQDFSMRSASTLVVLSNLMLHLSANATCAQHVRDHLAPDALH